MSHFYGTLKGQRGLATRTGSKSSGIQTTAASWNGAIRVEVYRDDGSDTDRFVVTEIPWMGCGVSRVLAEGVLGHPEEI